MGGVGSIENDHPPLHTWRLKIAIMMYYCRMLQAYISPIERFPNYTVGGIIIPMYGMEYQRGNRGSISKARIGIQMK